MQAVMMFVPWLGVLGMVAAVVTYFAVLKHPAGNETMQGISDKVYQGAMVFLKREYSIIAIFMVLVFIVLAVLTAFRVGSQGLQGL